MLLGGTVAGPFAGPGEWEQLLIRSGFKAVTAPFDCRTPRGEVDAYREICLKHGVRIAEIGVWKNVFDADPARAAEAKDYAVGQLALAEQTGIACCVNIAGTASTAGWDAADSSNFAPETYERVVLSMREIIDAVRPSSAFYCLEPMPWMLPDSPDTYLALLADVDRAQFAAHMDFVNMINCPRRYLAPEVFVEECFSKLGPYIKSTHIKDTRMHPTHLTTVLEECSPGEGTLDFRRILRIMDRYLPADAPVLLEHMTTFEEYRRAYDYVAAQAAEAGVAV
ncbi:MAG: sugar phosphate isomerase/epimerase [Clostridia bacterium]|nr:sugar phosphate isomerase/epimerase [Clostridia bacterium]